MGHGGITGGPLLELDELLAWALLELLLVPLLLDELLPVTLMQ